MWNYLQLFQLKRLTISMPLNLIYTNAGMFTNNTMVAFSDVYMIKFVLTCSIGLHCKPSPVWGGVGEGMGGTGVIHHLHLFL